MVPRAPARHSLGLRALILTGLVAFGFFAVAERGLLGLALDSDRSYISYLILAIYAAASAHWLVLSHRMSRERNRLARLEQSLASAGAEELEVAENGVSLAGEEWSGGDLASYLSNLLRKRESGALAGEQGALLTALGDEIANRHSTGHFASDTLLKLGLLGTMVGFILMLAPVAEMREFEAGLARQLLRDMSGGMAVALYTTLAGLVTSTLLKLQYQILDTSAQDLVNRVAILTDVYVAGAPLDSEHAA